jgi:hypothetical protein
MGFDISSRREKGTVEEFIYLKKRRREEFCNPSKRENDAEEKHLSL